MSDQQQNVRPAGQEAQTGSGGILSRRKLIAALGAAGVALASEGLLGKGGFVKTADAATVTISAVKDIAILKSISPAGLAANDLTVVEGYYLAGDGGGGSFYWDSASTEADNGGTVILPAGYAGTGRWKRVINDNRINVKWFGAKGNSGNDDTLAIQAAIDSLPSRGGTIYFPGGDYYINSTIVIGNGDAGANASTKSGIKLTGEGAGFGQISNAMIPTLLTASVPMGTMLDIRGRICDVHIEDLHIACALKASTGIKMNSASGTVMRNVKILHYSQTGLSIIGGNAPTGNYNISNVFENLFVGSTHNNAIALYMDGNYSVSNDTWLSTFRNCRFDTTGSTNSVAAWFKFVDSCSFYRCHFNCYDASSTGIIFDALTNDSFPAGMAFYDCSVVRTAVYEDSTHKIRKNYFYGFGTYDNEPIPTHPNLIGFTDDGRSFHMSLNFQPVSTAASGDLGNVQWINKGLSEAVVLPSGGKWEYDITLVNFSTNTFSRVGGIAAGGTQVNNTANVYKYVKIKKIEA